MFIRCLYKGKQDTPTQRMSVMTVLVLSFICANQNASNPDYNKNITDIPMYNSIADFTFELQEQWNASIPTSFCRKFEPDEEEAFTECLVYGYPILCITSTSISRKGESECNDNNTDFCIPCYPGTYGSSPSNCSACNPGSHSPDPGGTTCFACNPGTFAPTPGRVICDNCMIGEYSTEPGSTACNQCMEGVNFTSANASTHCIECSTFCSSDYDLRIPCTATSDLMCRHCPVVPNCVYPQSESCGNTSTPSCNCLAGFEMITGQCVPCQHGFFRNETKDSSPCVEWTQSQCIEGYFPVNGTRSHDSICLQCPDTPENTSLLLNGNGTACHEWACDAGFNNTDDDWY